MCNFRTFTRHVLCGLMSCLLVLTSMMQSAVMAQSAAPDVDLQPPIINLEEVELGNAGEVQVFTVEVTEDRELASVTLFHRLGGDQEYIASPMKELPGSTLFSASVPTDSDDVRNIEYYVQAEDTGGNRAIKGFVFDPLVRIIQVDPTATASGTTETTASSGGKRNLLWGLLGLVVLGVIVGAAGGGSSGGGEPQPEPNPTTELTIIVNPGSN